jgi:hypothetical protein
MKRQIPLLMLLIALGALALSQAATAASPARSTSTFAHPSPRDLAAEAEEEFEADGDEFEFEFEECESAGEEFEFEEGEEEEFEADEEEAEISCGDESAPVKATPQSTPSVSAPAPCQVREAESTITTLPGSDQVRLSVRYRTYAPTQVTVGLKLRDRKGSVAIEHATKHMSDKGVLHITTKLGTAVMERALAASEFDVALRAPETPGFCTGALEQRLRSVKHTGARAPRVYAG